jgi:hypothetical protein
MFWRVFEESFTVSAAASRADVLLHRVDGDGLVAPPAHGKYQGVVAFQNALVPSVSFNPGL